MKTMNEQYKQCKKLRILYSSKKIRVIKRLKKRKNCDPEAPFIHTTLALDYQSKFDSTLAGIRNELSDLRKDFKKLGSDLSVTRQVNSVLRERVTSLERQCWSNSQYSRHECLELTSIPETSDSNTLEKTVLKIFEKLEVKADPSNVEDCQWISSKNDPKRVIVKVSKRKDASTIRSSMRKLKNMDPTSIGINNPFT